jgi:hypothetical protein
VVNDKEKTAWQTTLAQYRAWNEAEFRANVRNARKKSLLQKWQEFLAIMDFGLMLKPMPSKHEQHQKVEMLNRYYEQMQRLAMRNVPHGKSV